ncbi:hypothetical protein INT45_009129 [Circinella minor]|uniref:Uncharacterized protein n=1 Tax=Circinella minor TaxID=1195481 RepID=A0A8H7VTD7_9FUNG|nr:hypothetical protein INT45_009129 [Circinella minor]
MWIIYACPVLLVDKSTKIRKLNYQGKEEVICVVVCEDCHKKFHRDGSAGNVQAYTAASNLEHGQRPQAAIRESRRINS